jgi:SMODS and SLOG-associating 2TM effector domain 1/Protein of unknown function (DUF4231)
MSADLELVAKRAATWSETADQLKRRLDLVRRIVFALSIAGALAAAIASQILPEAGAATSALPTSHTVFATLGAVLLAGATFLSSRLLRDTEVQAWVRARAAAEALKREAFRSATKAQPYDTSTADELLKKEREKIEGQLTDLRDRQVEAAREGSAPRGALNPEQYRERRVRPQIDWYRSKAHSYRKIATRLRWTEFTLALAATIITALAGALGKKLEIGPMAFDFAALTAVLTTVSGAIIAHIEASRYQHLVTSYLAAAARLEDLDTDFDAAGTNAGTWSEFVNGCEEAIAAENNSWVAKWTKATTS